MMYYVLMLTLAVGACAEAPDYLKAYLKTRDGSLLLLKRLDFVTPSAEQVSYAVLENAVTGIADLELLTNLPYDKVYVLGALLSQAVAKSAPALVRDIVKLRTELARQKTELLSKVIQENCPTKPYVRGGGATCNEKVHKLVLKSPKLREEAKLLLALGDLGTLYTEMEDALLDVAKKQKDTEYLATDGKKNLRELVTKTLETFKLLYKL